MKDESEEATGWRALFAKHRRRIGGVVLLALVILLVTHGSTVIPTSVHLVLPLSDAAGIDEAEVSLRDEAGEEAYHLRQRFSGDAPSELSVEADLLAGRYDVVLRILRGDAVSELVGEVEAPADGEVRVHLHAP